MYPKSGILSKFYVYMYIKNAGDRNTSRMLREGAGRCCVPQSEAEAADLQLQGACSRWTFAVHFPQLSTVLEFLKRMQPSKVVRTSLLS